MNKARILVARAVFPEMIARLEQHFDVEHNQADEPWSKQQLADRLHDKVGAFTTGSERIDAEVLAACAATEDLRQHGRRLQQLRPAGDDGARACWPPTRPTC